MKSGVLVLLFGGLGLTVAWQSRWLDSGINGLCDPGARPSTFKHSVSASSAKNMRELHKIRRLAPLKGPWVRG